MCMDMYVLIDSCLDIKGDIYINITMKRVHILIDGRVQGVGFRHFTRTNANKIGITGWVKNLANGQVEVTAEGEEKNIDKFIELLKTGPRLAAVTELETEVQEYKDEFNSFKVRF